MILVIGLNPVIQRTLFFNSIKLGAVNRADKNYVSASGKGVNVSRVLSQLQTSYVHLTHSGGNQDQFFRQLCAVDGLNVEYCSSDSEIRTCVTCIDLNNKCVTEYVEESNTVSDVLSDRILEKYSRLLKKASTVVISGTVAKGYRPDIIPLLTEQAKENGSTVILDVKGEDLKNCLPFSPEYIKPNLGEFTNTFLPDALSVEHQDEITSKPLIEKALEKALEISKSYTSAVILTNGSDGTYLAENNCIRHFPVQQITPVNTIGCGDAFTAGLAFYRKNKSTEEGILFAQECARRNALTHLPGSLTGEPGST